MTNTLDTDHGVLDNDVFRVFVFDSHTCSAYTTVPP
jgi:hypothetical protein